MPELKCQTATYSQSTHNSGEWALVHKGELAGIFNSFESASRESAARFRRRRCLIRQINTPAIMLTAAAENLRAGDSKLFMSLQKWTRFVTRRLFSANEMSF
jgi:hypothetical protein